MELFVLGFMATALFRLTGSLSEPGDIFAIFRYLMLFLMGLDTIPMLVQKTSRLREITQRLGDSGEPIVGATDKAGMQ